MSVQILEGECGYKVMYCSTTMWAFGSIFYHEEDVDSFLKWLRDDPRSLTDSDLSQKIEEWRSSEECEDCDGTGVNQFSCCDRDMRSNDWGVCPECKEHWTVDEDDQCDSCNGSGVCREDNYSMPGFEEIKDLLNDIKLIKEV